VAADLVRDLLDAGPPLDGALALVEEADPAVRLRAVSARRHLRSRHD
jgi:hypothetical protein